MEIETAQPAIPASHRRVVRFLVLLATLGCLALAPILRKLQIALHPDAAVGWTGILLECVLQAALCVPAVWIGVRLGNCVGLGPRDIEKALDREPGAGRALWADIRRGMMIGVPLGIGALASGYLRHQEPRIELSSPTILQGALAAFGAGITEEIGFRLFAMTLFVWLFSRRSRPKVSVRALWAGNALAAIAFGAMHLPQARELFVLDAPIVSHVMIANGVIGLICGWLYWRRGLAAAMATHISIDIVLHALAPQLPLPS